MRLWYNNLADSRRYAAEIVGTTVRIGRGPENDVVLNSPYVAHQAAVLQLADERWKLISVGLNGCQIDGEDIPANTWCDLPPKSRFQLFPYYFSFERPEVIEDSAALLRHGLDDAVGDLVRRMHVQLLSELDLNSTTQDQLQDERYLLSIERKIDDIARACGTPEAENAALVNHIAGQFMRGRLLEEVLSKHGPSAWALLDGSPGWTQCLASVPHLDDDLERLANTLSSQLDVYATEDVSIQAEAIENGFWTAWEATLPTLLQEFRDYLCLRQLRKQIKDIVFGYGPLEDLLRTPSISEIMVVGASRIYIEKNGIVENSGRRFISDEVTLSVIERIVSKVGRRIDKSQPLVDARLTDGSRVNAVIPPVAVHGPCLTIRKFPERRMTVDDLVQRNSITPQAVEFLRAAVVKRCNILIAGGTGSGKTTLLNILSDFIPDKERIVTIEDTAELQLHKEHVAAMETKHANIEGSGAYTIRDLVRNSLRMRPDRIVVGECRGKEALDMLQAMNTGHDGSMTTLHANSAEEVVPRLEVLVLAAADLPVASIHRQIAYAVDLIVQLNRMKDGTRRVTQITEVAGVDEQFGGIRMKDIFRLEGEAHPQLRPTGCLPSFMDRLIASGGIDLDILFR